LTFHIHFYQQLNFPSSFGARDLDVGSAPETFIREKVKARPLLSCGGTEGLGLQQSEVWTVGRQHIPLSVQQSGWLPDHWTPGVVVKPTV
jgi:hypothetical protein